MRIKKCVLFVFIMLFIHCAQVYAQWNSQGYPHSYDTSGSSGSSSSSSSKSSTSSGSKSEQSSGGSSNSSWEKRSFLSQIFGAKRNLLGI